MKKSLHYVSSLGMLAALIVSGCGTGTEKAASSGQGSAAVQKAPEPAGANCQYGGIAVYMGIDANGNGILDVSERKGNPEYVCNGAPGAAGDTGVAGTTGVKGDKGDKGDTGNTGLKALVDISDVQPGSICANGGKKVSSGLDANNNGVLESAEESESSPVYICNGADLTASVTALKAQITLVTAASSTVPGTVVSFNLKDQNDKPVATFPTAWTLSFTYVKLGSDGQWKSYLNSSVTGTNKYTNQSNPVKQAATQANGTVTNLGAGNYSYTFTSDKTTAEAVTYEPSRTHRIGMQMRGSGSLKSVNTVYDFVPAGGAVTENRKIATTASCKECHGDAFAFHGSQRVEVEHCVTCHNPGTTDPESGNTVNMATMIHKIHMGHNLPSVEAGGEYAIWGYGGSKHDYSHVGYPQEITNCLKCHNGEDSATPQGDNWKTKPSIAACGACHDDVNFATGTGHSAQANDANCALCHTATYIETKHLTENATPNNPNVATGLVNFDYIVSSVTVTNGTQPVVKFQIKKDGLATTFTGTGSTASQAPAGAVLTGFSGSPSFLIAYADGTDSTVDYNNKGKAAAQPNSVSIAYLLASGNTRGTITGPDTAGYYTASITDPAYGFPAGSKLRTIVLQGYFTQVAGTGGIAANTARHTLSSVKEVAGEARRSVVDPAKCASCHEVFEGHGGNRNIGANTTGTIVCVVCHNPNLTSSGRKGNVANMAQDQKDALIANGYDVATALNFPEATNNMKDMIHGIHASHKRETKYDFVRDRNGGLYYDWSHVTFPGVLSNCETCHKPGTYGAVPAGALITTDIIGSEATTTTAVNTLRSSAPNADDLVSTPIAATCVACHDSATAKTHMTQNGGKLLVARSSANASSESCTICHGAGRSANLVDVHK